MTNPTHPAAAEMEKAARATLEVSGCTVHPMGSVFEQECGSEGEAIEFADILAGWMGDFALSREREAVRKCYAQCQWGSDKIRIREAYPEHFKED